MPLLVEVKVPHDLWRACCLLLVPPSAQAHCHCVDHLAPGLIAALINLLALPSAGLICGRRGRRFPAELGPLDPLLKSRTRLRSQLAVATAWCMSFSLASAPWMRTAWALFAVRIVCRLAMAIANATPRAAAPENQPLETAGGKATVLQ